MKDPPSEETMEQQDSSLERNPHSRKGICHVGALQCTHCLITFANSKFQEHHMKWENPAVFMAQKLQGALIICFTCACSFLSSMTLITHQCGHSPALRFSPLVAASIAQPTFPRIGCGKTFLWAAHFSEVALPGAQSPCPFWILCLH